MKIKYLILFCFFSIITNAQIASLSKLSSGKFYSSDEIKDSNNNIKGYFLLFESDKVAKETLELEYVVLDENLTKVTNGFITEMKFESFLVDADNIRVKASLFKNKLLLELTDNFKGFEAYSRYRMLDVNDNGISTPFIYVNDSIKMNPVFDRKLKNARQSDDLKFYDGVGLIGEGVLYDKKDRPVNNYLTHFDGDLKQVWKYVYDDNLQDRKAKHKTIRYLNSDEDVMVYFTHSMKKYTYINDFSTLFIDAKTGKLISEFAFPNMDKYAYKVVDCKIKDDKIYVMGNYSITSQYGNTNDTKNTGLFNYVFDKQTAKLIDSKLLTWESLSPKLPVNKNGEVKKEGFLFAHNMLLLNNGKIIVVTETFIQGPVTTNNMYFLELSPEFTINQVFEVTKFRNKFPGTLAHSDDIKRYGLFDFIDYQNMGDDEFLFFLNDNEKKSKNRKKSTLYGIISYADGVFKRQTLNLKTETSTVRASNAKKGYLMMVEDFDQKDKPTELRLEKINY